MSDFLITKHLDAVTTTATGASQATPHAERTYQATVTGTGAVTATVLVEVSNDNTNWLTAITFTLSGTTTASDGSTMTAPWAFTRGRVSAISGTGAAVTLIGAV